jgi:hypothetical protein
MRITTGILTALACCACLQSKAFCGFYVAKADTKIYNQASQVILVHDGNQTVITMSNDFKGDVKDFAMVVPVPGVLQKDDIKVVERQVFDKLDAYSAPRLVEYYDNNPCEQMRYKMMAKSAAPMASMGAGMAEDESRAKKDYGVTIEAKYTVGEYDIIILGAEQSNGLQRWLTDNGYKIPANAEEVLNPYIRANLKFFVVKVNLEKLDGDYQTLRPIQLKFNSPRFGLPIRLGMANSMGDQDLIIYAFTKRGRVECTNYRTMKMNTGIKVPEFVQDDFAPFYADAFKKSWKREGQDAIFLEYAWDVSSSNYVKCDPCVSNPPDYKDLEDAGVWWVTGGNSQNYYGSADFNGNVFFTRLHVRYNRSHYAQDLAFQVTPNNEQYQVRYVITHPAAGTFSCAEGRRYVREVAARREEELQNMNRLAGWSIYKHEDYLDDWNRQHGNNYNRIRQGSIGDTDSKGGALIIGFLVLQGIALYFTLRRKM